MTLVLLIEDDEDIRELVERFLTNGGYEVDAAENGSSAIKKAIQRTYEIIVSDILMPGMDGPNAVEQILLSYGRSLGENYERRRPEVIFMSGECSEAQRKKAEGISRRKVLEKPFSPKEELLPLVQEMELKYKERGSA